MATGTMAALAFLSVGCADDPLADKLESSGAQAYDEEADSRPDPAVDPALAPYLESGNDVCRRALRPLRELAAPTSPEEWIELAEVATTAYNETLAGLRSLTPPVTDVEQVDGIHKRIGAVIETLDEMVAADPDDPAAMQTLVAEWTAGQTATSAAFADYGLNTCAG